MTVDEAGTDGAAEIAELERTFMDAVRDRDMARLERLLGGDFTLTTGRRGREVRSRAEWLEVTDREYVIDDYAFEELEVQHYGSCAIARSRYRQVGRMGGERRDGAYRMTDVWVRMPDGWRLQARHAQPVAGD
ncbi:MAG: nuclear transport factor 2 family protein [Actinobacteria bacterium]|nr:nuclear transport factor 2 family protein [Actinomycetota bacterium]